MKVFLSSKEAGKKGGEVTKRRKGKKFYQRIGQKGGVATRDKNGADYFSRIGRIGGSRTAENKHSLS